jgi:hypothetical protein
VTVPQPWFMLIVQPQPPRPTLAMVLAAPEQVPGGGVPNPAPTPAPGLAPVAEMFLGWGKWTLIVGGVLGMFIGQTRHSKRASDRSDRPGCGTGWP